LATNFSEDCLNLNVYTPIPTSLNPGPWPVMMFIYGGAFSMGTSMLGIYSGQYLASMGNVVVVTGDYRVGVLGFLVTQQLQGNYGILDQILIQRRMVHSIRNYYLSKYLGYPCYPNTLGDYTHIELSAVNGYEIQCFQQYLVATKIVDTVEQSKELPATVDLFTLWNIFEAAIANLMLNSEPINAMDEGSRQYFFDGRIMSLSVDGMMQFYSSMPALLDLQDFAKQIALPFCNKINSLRVPFSQAVLDEVELAALLHVVFSMIDSVPTNIRVSLIRQRNQILTELREHYRQTGQDFSVRLGRLAELVEHLLQSLKAMKEHFTVLQLYMQTARIPTQEDIMFGQLYQHR